VGAPVSGGAAPPSSADPSPNPQSANDPDPREGRGTQRCTSRAARKFSKAARTLRANMASMQASKAAAAAPYVQPNPPRLSPQYIQWSNTLANDPPSLIFGTSFPSTLKYIDTLCSAQSVSNPPSLAAPPTSS